MTHWLKFPDKVFAYLLLLFICTWSTKGFGQETESTTWPERLGPAEITTQAGKARLGFFGQLLSSFDSKETGDERQESFDFVPRRVRLIPRGSFLQQRLNLYLQLSTVPRSVELMDFYIDYKVLDALQIRIGQFKVPFTRYRQQSYSNALLVDWANVSPYFGAERQLGALFHNQKAESRFEYAFSVQSGQNRRAAHGVGPALIYGEQRPNPSNLINPANTEDFHPELFLRVGHRSFGIDSFNPSDDKRKPLRHTESISMAWDLDPTERQDHTLRFSPEFMLKAHGLSVILGGYLGFYDLTQRDKTRLGLVGTLIETAYRFDRHWEVAARFSRVDVLRHIREDVKYWVQTLIADADPDDVDSLQERYQNFGYLKAEQEVTIGVSAYIVGTELRWTNDLSWIHKNGEEQDVEDYRIRSQIQLGF